MSAVLETKLKQDPLTALKAYIDKCKQNDTTEDRSYYITTLGQSLYSAIQNNQILEVKFLLDCAYKEMTRMDSRRDFKQWLASYRDSDKNTFLTLACRYASKAIVELLLNRGVCINQENYDSHYSPYLYAIRFNRRDIKEYLETYESTSWFVKMNKRASNGKTAFMAAAEGGHVALMEELLKKDKEAYCQNQNDGYTPLMAAIWSGSMDAVNLILRIDPHSYKAKTAYGFTPFMGAIQSNLLSLMKFILEKDKSVIRGCLYIRYVGIYHDAWTPLCYAVKANSIPAIECILNVDPDLIFDLVTGSDMSIVSFAAKHGGLETLKYLIAHGAHMYKVSKNNFSYEKRKNEFDYAKERGNAEILGYLNQIHDLFHCVRTGNLSKIKEYVKSGIPLNINGEKGNTLLHVALQYGQEEVAIYLMEQGLSRSVTNRQIIHDDGQIYREAMNPFQYAVYESNWIDGTGKNPLTILKEMMRRVATSDIDKKELEEKLKALQKDYDDLILYAKHNPVIKDKDDTQTRRTKTKVYNALRLDFEELAITMDRKYWSHFAQEVIELQKTDHNANDYCAKYQKLSHLVYSCHVICKVNEKGTLIAFDPPKGSEAAVFGLESKSEAETDKDRNTRLTYALRFAIEADDFASAMRLACEMTTENPDLRSVSEAGLKGEKIKSRLDFMIEFAQMHYKPKKPESVSESEPVPASESEPITFKYQSSKSQISASLSTSVNILPLDI